MFSCFKASRGSGHQKAKSCCLVRFWRRLIRPLTHFRHASHSEPKVSLPKRPRFNYKSRGYIQQMIHYIPTAIQNGDRLCLGYFLAMYRYRATTWEVLDLLMKTYASFRPDSLEDQQTKSFIFIFLFDWFERFPQDFYEAPDLVVLSQFKEYVRLNGPTPVIETQAREPITMLEDQKAISLKLEEDRATTAEPPEQDASGRQETLSLRPASVTEPQGDGKPREDTELVQRAVLDPCEPKAAIELLPTLDQALPTSDDTHSPVDVAADETAVVAADVKTARPLFVSYTVQLGTPDFVFPLPEVDI